MNVTDIYKILNQEFPFSDAMDFDNCGILLNHNDVEISKVFIALDLNSANLAIAIKNKANLIITHHPFIFNSFNEEMAFKWKKDIWHKLEEFKINLIAMHTNVDTSKKGLNASLMTALNIKKWSFFNKDHLGLIGQLDREIKLENFIPVLKSAWYLKHIKFLGDPNAICKTIAIVGGSGGEYFNDAHHQKADLFISSEIKWHQYVAANELNLNVIEVCHSIEWFFTITIRNLLEQYHLDVIEDRNMLDIEYY